MKVFETCKVADRNERTGGVSAAGDHHLAELKIMKRRDGACEALLDALSDHSIIKAEFKSGRGQSSFSPLGQPLNKHCAEVHYMQYLQKSVLAYTLCEVKDLEAVLHLCIEQHSDHI